MSVCPQCGTASVREGQRFCARCGTDLSGPPAPQTVAGIQPPPAYGQPPRISGPLFADDIAPPPPVHVAPPPPAQPQPFAPVPAPVPQPMPYDGGAAGRRRTPALVLAVAALVAALVGAAGVVLLLDSDDDEASGTSAQDERAEDVATNDVAATPTVTPSETPTETEEPRTFTCWDGGAPVARPSDCGLPSGAEGMAWVFPSTEDPSCFTAPGVNRATESDCTATVAGAGVRVHYSEWRDRANLESYYRGLAVGPIDPPDGRDDLTALQVVSRASDVGYKVAIYYSSAAGLWSVTVYAADEQQYLATLQQLSIRRFAQLRGGRA